MYSWSERTIDECMLTRESSWRTQLLPSAVMESQVAANHGSLCSCDLWTWNWVHSGKPTLSLASHRPPCLHPRCVWEIYILLCENNDNWEHGGRIWLPGITCNALVDLMRRHVILFDCKELWNTWVWPWYSYMTLTFDLQAPITIELPNLKNIWMFRYFDCSYIFSLNKTGMEPCLA